MCLTSSDGGHWLINPKRGGNLQLANHVVFVSSLVTRTRHVYKSIMTQAIGRVLRIGQNKDVHVYYFVAEKTIDVNILQEREEKTLVTRGGECLLVTEPQDGDAKDFG